MRASLAARANLGGLSAVVRHALDAVSDALVVIDPGSIVVFANQEAERLFGVRRGALAGASFSELTPRSVCDPQLGLLSDFLASRRLGPELCSFTFVGLKNSGEEFSAELSLRTMVGEHHVIATIHQRAGVLHQPERNPVSGASGAEAVKSAPQPSEQKTAALVDMHGRIVSVNEAWRRFGRANNATPETIEGVGLDYFAVCLKSDEPLAQVVAQGIRRVLNGTSRSFSQIYGCHSPEETRWYRIEVTARNGEPGAVIVHALYH